MTYLLPLAALLIGFLLGRYYTAHQFSELLQRAKSDATRAEATLEAERTHARETRQQAELARTKELDALRTEMRAMSAELAQKQGAALRQQHTDHLQSLLQPLTKDIETFREQFLKGNAETDKRLSLLAEQSNALGREAEALVKALRADSKQQGDWGEQILERLLESSGLTRGRDYDVQAQTANAEGRALRPDVLIYLPGQRTLVIDSKVSLTAFSAIHLAETDGERLRLRREHLHSVRRHVDELAAKSYQAVVKDAIGHVLMFIPHEAAYLAALDEDPNLLTEAYKKQVIIINPSNLFMALQLAYNLWQSERQTQSVQDIYQSAEKLHKKFVTFAQNYQRIGASIDSLRKTYDESYAQLATGRGNIVRQLDAWREKGFTPTTDIPSQLLEDAHRDTPDSLLTGE